MSTTAAPTAATQPAPPPVDGAPPPAPAPPPPAAAAFVWLHEEEGGDGRIHVVIAGAPADAACSCGTAMPPTAARIPPDDPQLGFRPPEMFCDAARALLAPKAAAAAQTQAIANAAKVEAVPFEPRDTAEMFRYAKFLAQSDLIPKALQRNASNVLVVLLKGKDLGLTPMQSISGINVIDGKAEVGALMMVSMILKSGVCEFWELVESDATKCTYSTKRRNGRRDVTFTYTVDEAREAGLLDKGKDEYARKRSPWNTQRRTMLRRRCQSMLAREVYPDIVAGLYDHEELQEMRELEIELIKTGMRASAAGFQPDPMDPPGWMAPAAASSSPPVDSAAARDAAPVEVLPVQPAPPRKPPADPLKERLAKKAAAAKPADTQPAPAPDEVACLRCQCPIDPPPPGAPQLCYACQNE